MVEVTVEKRGEKSRCEGEVRVGWKKRQKETVRQKEVGEREEVMVRKEE